MPKELDELQKKIWEGLKGKTNPKTKKPYTESDAWAIAKSRFKSSGKSMSVFSDDSQTVSESDILSQAISEIGGS